MENRNNTRRVEEICQLLIHIKGPSDEPGDFRPITLESVPLKIFTACIRDTIFDFIMPNNCIDCKLQKGFMPKVSGTFEHTAHMTHIIKISSDNIIRPGKCLW